MYFNQFPANLWTTENEMYTLWPALYSALYPFVSTHPHPSIHGAWLPVWVWYDDPDVSWPHDNHALGREHRFVVDT
jgi:hypothetical protein